jgi:hypothetical protein
MFDEVGIISRKLIPVSRVRLLVDRDFKRQQTSLEILVLKLGAIAPRKFRAWGISMALTRLACVLSITSFFSVWQGEVQVPTLHPELIAGPWEVASASGIDGIFFNIETSSGSPNGRQEFDWQTINILVYRRQGGKETWGWFATKDKATPESYSMQDDHSYALFDGERLRIHFSDVTDLEPFDLDISFSPATQDWAGTWSRSHQNFHVVLKRPEPNPSVTPNVFVGDWAGESSKPYLAPGSLHIRQSRDGALSAWLDRTIAVNDQRNGELLRVYSVTASGLLLERPGDTGPSSHYRGILSEDRQVLTGTWAQAGGGGLNAPDRFRRAPARTAQ